MAKLNIDQKTILQLLGDKKVDFLIPDYQRPFAWGEDECSSLWVDFFDFAIPNGNCDQFDNSEEYFLGPIVTFKNDDGKLEVIDGQQRLTTIMLLLRAFYPKFKFQKDQKSVNTKQNLERCIWKTDEFNTPDMDELKINSEVASDNDKEEFLYILRTGDASPDRTSSYATTYRFFEEKIAEFVETYPSYTPYLPNRIMNNVIFLPIEAESQSTALRIFNTLNDRGLPLSDADIFKSQFYKYFSDKGEKDDFVERWRDLEDRCERVFKPKQGTPMDELFMRYMYYLRAKEGRKDVTAVSLRSYYEKNQYDALKSDKTFADLEDLSIFWENVSKQADCFSKEALRRLFILNYAPNSMWTNVVSTYFMANRDSNGNLQDKPFCEFLALITGFIWAYAIERPGVNALRTPLYPELVNIVRGRQVTFERFRFDRKNIKPALMNYKFTNTRPITRSMLTWWAFNDRKQPLFELDKKFDIEHIFARKRADVQGALENPDSLELLGNKALLERRINVSASDYRFADKKKHYLGYKSKSGRQIDGTQIIELKNLAKNKKDFTEHDIMDRTEKIVNAFIRYLGKNGLLTN